MTKIIFALLATLCLNVTAQAAANIQITPVTSEESVTTQDYGSHYFGRVMTHTRAIARFTITNTGDEPLDFVNANIWGMFFDAYHNCMGTLLPQHRCRFDITYWPSFEGHHTGDFVMNFKQDAVQIHVWGQAYKQF